MHYEQLSNRGLQERFFCGRSNVLEFSSSVFQIFQRTEHFHIKIKTHLFQIDFPP